MLSYIFHNVLTSVRFKRSFWTLVGITVALVGMIFLAVGVGAVFISPGQVLGIFAEQINLSLPWSAGTREQIILLNIRLPRVLLTMMVGAALSVSGAAMQGLFRNRWLIPGLLGSPMGLP